MDTTGCPGVNCGIFLQTQDGGESWDTTLFDQALFEVEFIDQDTGFVGSDGILKTMDGGATWELEAGTDIGEVSRIDFPDPEVGYALARISGQAWLLKKDPSTAINEPDRINKLSVTVFPNPAGNKVNISCTFSQWSDVVIEMLDITGRPVQPPVQFSTENVAPVQSIQTGHLAPGLYFIRGTCNDQVFVKQVMIIKEKL